MSWRAWSFLHISGVASHKVYFCESGILHNWGMHILGYKCNCNKNNNIFLLLFADRDQTEEGGWH